MGTVMKYDVCCLFVCVVGFGLGFLSVCLFFNLVQCSSDSIRNRAALLQSVSVWNLVFCPENTVLLQ